MRLSGIGSVSVRFPCDGAQGRLLASAGTTDARRASQGARYLSGAFVPRAPWRSLARPEWRVLQERGHTRCHGARIEVIRIPESLLAGFEAVAPILRGEDSEAARTFAQSSACAGAIERIGEFLVASGMGRRIIERNSGLSFQRAGRLTATIDPRNQKRIGLHIDSFFSLGVHGRASAPNRICINLGISSRCLLFVNLTIDEIARRVCGRMGASVAWRRRLFADCNLLITSFFQCFPHYPVLRLRIDPGDAYIAPTENVIHDGMTKGMHSADATLTFLGEFSTAAFPDGETWRAPTTSR